MVGKVINCGYANPYTDPVITKASDLLVQTVVSHLNDHLAIGLWNLGNEPDLFAKPPDATTGGRAWIKRMVNLIRKLDSVHPITCGLRLESLVDDNGLLVNEFMVKWISP